MLPSSQNLGRRLWNQIPTQPPFGLPLRKRPQDTAAPTSCPKPLFAALRAHESGLTAHGHALRAPQGPRVYGTKISSLFLSSALVLKTNTVPGAQTTLSTVRCSERLWAGEVPVGPLWRRKLNPEAPAGLRLRLGSLMGEGRAMACPRRCQARGGSGQARRAGSLCHQQCHFPAPPS